MTDLDAVQAQATQSVLLAIEQLISGERTIAEFRDEMLNVVYEHPTVATPVRHLIDDYGRRGLIPEQIHRLLSRDIDKATSEEMPTTPTEFPYQREATESIGEETIGVLERSVEELTSDSDMESRPTTVSGIEIGSLLRDRFEIIGRATGGSMGVVYKAIDRRLAEMTGGEPTVAIKVLAPAYSGNKSAVKALQQEAAKGRYLNHPNIVRFLDVDRSDGQVFLVMEWLNGKSLSDILTEKKGEPLPRDQVLDILRQVGNALVHAHSVGVTHADVKPGNVMVLDDGTAKLLDFGIARARGDAAAQELAGDDSFLQAATPAFASPAMLQGDAAKPVDDVFSLACLAYRLLGGRRVFRNRTALDAMVDGNAAPRIKNLESRYWKALERALALDDTVRTPTVEAFMQELGIGTRDSGRPRWGFYAGIAAALGALSLIAIISPRWNSTPTLDATVSLPEMLSEPSIASDAAVVEAQSPRPIAIPIPEFLVTSAEWVNDSNPGNSATLILPFSEGQTLPVIDVGEGSERQQIRLHMPDVAEPVQVQLRRSGVAPALRRILSEHLRLVTPEPFTFAADRRRLVVVFENIADDLVEPDGLVRYDVIRAADGLVLGGFSLRLIDDDRVRIGSGIDVDTISFAQDNITVTENDGAVTLTLWRLNASADAFEAAFTVTPMSARDYDDYVAPVDMRVRFDAGQNAATVFIPIVSDAEEEPVELFRVTLNTPSATPDIQTNVTVRILDEL